MAVAQAITLGDQVRLRFVGWPKTVRTLTKDGVVDAPHPKEGQPLKLFWNSRPYVCSPGQDIYIPFELAKKEYGDPRSVEGVYRIKDEWGEEQIIPDRFAEVRRLQNYHQNSIVQFREYIPGDRSFLKDGISDLLPIVEIYSMTGERITMVTDDPYGDTVVVANRTRAEMSEQQQIMVEQSEFITELRRTNQLLLKKLGLREEDLETLGDDVPVPQPKPVTGLDTAPMNATVSSHPSMVYNPKTHKIEPKRTVPPDADPSAIQDLPVDLD